MLLYAKNHGKTVTIMFMMNVYRTVCILWRQGKYCNFEQGSVVDTPYLSKHHVHLNRVQGEGGQGRSWIFATSCRIERALQHE